MGEKIASPGKKGEGLKAEKVRRRVIKGKRDQIRSQKNKGTFLVGRRLLSTVRGQRQKKKRKKGRSGTSEENQDQRARLMLRGQLIEKRRRLGLSSMRKKSLSRSKKRTNMNLSGRGLFGEERKEKRENSKSGFKGRGEEATVFKFAKEVCYTRTKK